MEQLFGKRMIFLNIKDSKESADDRSKYNVDEAELTRQLIEFIAYNSINNGNIRDIKGMIGVISPYKS